MFKPLEKIEFLDLHPQLSSFKEDVINGLSAKKKWLSSMYFYDERGSKLFTQICDLDEYYPTRTEIGIITENIQDIIAEISDQAFLIELGSGASEKIKLLLSEMKTGASYMALDISKDFLISSALQLAELFPHIDISAVCADFTQISEIKVLHHDYHNKVLFFPGSTIGNFDPNEAVTILKEARSALRKGDGFLIGIDLEKDQSTLEAAYDDSQGITAQFNLNILERINRELNGNFNLENFRHQALYNKDLHRVEMHLISKCEQVISIENKTFRFNKNEAIHTENSYKYNDNRMDHLFAESGFSLKKSWRDKKNYFSFNYLEAI